MKMQKGFTLIEVMVVVVILAIILSVAIPSYRDYVIRGKLTEATAGLSQGKIRMEQSFQDNRAYGTVPCPAPTGSFSFTCTNPNGNTSFLITATGLPSTPVDGFVYTINEQNAKTSTTPWGNGACWLTQKGAVGC